MQQAEHDMCLWSRAISCNLQHVLSVFGSIPRLVRNSLLSWPSADSRICSVSHNAPGLQATAHASTFAHVQLSCLLNVFCSHFFCVCLGVEQVVLAPVVTCSGCGTSQATPPWRLPCGFGCLELSIWPVTARGCNGVHVENI